MHERAVDRSKVILKCPCKTQTNVDDSVTSQRKHIVLKVLIKEVLRLVHHFFAHDDIKLATLVACLLTISKVVLDDLDDSSLLVSFVRELV